MRTIVSPTPTPPVAQTWSPLREAIGSAAGTLARCRDCCLAADLDMPSVSTTVTEIGRQPRELPRSRGDSTLRGRTLALDEEGSAPPHTSRGLYVGVRSYRFHRLLHDGACIDRRALELHQVAEDRRYIERSAMSRVCTFAFRSMVSSARSRFEDRARRFAASASSRRSPSAAFATRATASSETVLHAVGGFGLVARPSLNGWLAALVSAPLGDVADELANVGSFLVGQLRSSVHWKLVAVGVHRRIRSAAR
jgi:hypothetical protein